ncbi:hypothetical protein BBR47_05410 [Brevibacillus brevis NBRC 100599]|uniref:Uncharacterized protein n=1 Tax=Brevibacillus brevis (strain 47 / JCM 6285 / NBRC 100599) TaxID=358681 RepID=C0ZK67_BREBN|nr:hypothetical protein BBR47_05410 [Brevibacillus brevis NBRC 100599]
MIAVVIIDLPFRDPYELISLYGRNEAGTIELYFRKLTLL